MGVKTRVLEFGGVVEGGFWGGFERLVLRFYFGLL